MRSFFHICGALKRRNCVEMNGNKQLISETKCYSHKTKTVILTMEMNGNRLHLFIITWTHVYTVQRSSTNSTQHHISAIQFRWQPCAGRRRIHKFYIWFVFFTLKWIFNLVLCVKEVFRCEKCSFVHHMRYSKRFKSINYATLISAK